MNHSTLDALARRAGSVHDRRASLKTLGVAALAGALAAPRRADAKPSAGKKARKKVEQQCRQQAGQCSAFHVELCEQVTCVPEALEKSLDCCEAFPRHCDVSRLLACLFDVA